MVPMMLNCSVKLPKGSDRSIQTNAMRRKTLTPGLCGIKMKHWGIQGHTHAVYTIPNLFYWAVPGKSRTFVQNRQCFFLFVDRNPGV